MFYAAIALGAVAAFAAAAGESPRTATIAAVAAAAVVGVLFAVSPMLATTAKTARKLLVATGIAAGIGGSVGVRALSDLSTAGMLGAIAGTLAATIVGVAWIRRRLARDDALFARQMRLGFDPERPSAWLRGDER